MFYIRNVDIDAILTSYERLQRVFVDYVHDSLYDRIICIDEAVISYELL